MAMVAVHFDAKAIEAVEHSVTFGWGAPLFEPATSSLTCLSYTVAHFSIAACHLKPDAAPRPSV